MALTDNTFTAEEFAAATTANPELLKTVSGHLTAQKWHVMPDADHQTYLKNYEANVIGVKTKEFADNIEKDVEALTGIKKSDSNMKYYDYLKTAVAKKLESVTELEKQITTLKEKGGTSELDKQRIAALEQQIEKTKGEYSDKLTAAQIELNNTRSLHTIEKALSPHRAAYKSTIPKEMAEMYESNIIADVQKRYKIQDDGTVTLLQDDGKTVMLNAKFAPMSVDEYVADKIKPLLDEGKKLEGAGTKKDDAAAAAGSGEAKKWDGVLPADVKTQVQLSNYLYGIGVTSDSKEYKEAMEKYKELPMR